MMAHIGASILNVVFFNQILLTTGFTLISGRNSLFSLAESESGHKLFFQDQPPKENVMLRTGETLSLECEAGGSPSPTIHWLFQGDRIPQGKAATLDDDEASFEDTIGNRHMKTLKLGTTKSKLLIDCMTSHDTGDYTCVAETPYMRISATTNVVVVPASRHHKALEDECVEKRTNSAPMPPKINMWTVQRLEFEGADVQLYCRADGSPQPSVTWYGRDDQPISVNDPQHTILANGDLLIKGINWMANMGLYRCRAQNEFGSDEATVFLYPTTPE